MKSIYWKIIFIFLISAVLVAGGFLIFRSQIFPPETDETTSNQIVETPSSTVTEQPNSAASETPTSDIAETPAQEFVEPVAEFQTRIIKKPFGLYVSPQNSPVSQERFTGYHTAVDVEYEDSNADVPVFAVADGEIKLASTASGYGGVMILSFRYNNQETFAVYGHLRPSSFTAKTTVQKGEQIAVLGTGYSSETDNERKHLHFGLAKTQNLRGYVASEAELSGWYNPLEIIK